MDDAHSDASDSRDDEFYRHWLRATLDSGESDDGTGARTGGEDDADFVRGEDDSSGDGSARVSKRRGSFEILLHAARSGRGLDHLVEILAKSGAGGRPTGDGTIGRRRIFRGRVAAAPRPRRGYSAETSRGGAAAGPWIFRGDEEGRG